MDSGWAFQVALATALARVAPLNGRTGGRSQLGGGMGTSACLGKGWAPPLEERTANEWLPIRASRTIGRGQTDLGKEASQTGQASACICVHDINIIIKVLWHFECFTD